MSLEHLPESRKKLIFFAVMTVVILGMFFIGIILTKNNLTIIGKSFKGINLPKLDIKDREMPGLNISKEDFENFGEMMENSNVENTSQDTQETLENPN